MRNVRLKVPIPTPPVGHRRSSSYLRTIILFSIVVFIWLQINVSFYREECETLGDATNDSMAILNMVPKDFQKYLRPKPRTGNSSMDNTRQRMSISEIQADIDKFNERQYVHNEDIFGPLQNDSLVIVIQVHERILYLRHLIVSLAQARGIDSVLLIFSHDHYDTEINDLVQSIDFCKVLQIFYPYSIQTHPNSFPGPSPNDCPRDMSIEEALKKKCVNAEWPDLYGHYREANFTQTKHHWWWKANRVFSNLEVTRHHTGLVLFLEEDHYLAEDFVYLLQLMQQTAIKNCPKCDVYSLGTYHKTYLRNYYYVNAKKVEVTAWISSRHNMGMAMDRRVWNQIRKCAFNFCTYDDYNWDWSLQVVSKACLRKEMEVMMPRAPRIFHIGECGFHHKKENCEGTAVVSRLQNLLRSSKNYLFPKRIVIVSTTIVRRLPLKSGNGGWTDLRDQQLCLNMSSSLPS